MTAKNQQILVLASDERTATVTSDPIRNARHRGVRIHTKVTAKEATPSLTVKVQGWDNLNETAYDILSGVALTDVGEQYLVIYPGIGDRAYDDDGAIAGVKDAPLPAWFRVVATHGDTDEITYSVTAELLV